jgi:hypothetical protein
MKTVPLSGRNPRRRRKPTEEETEMQDQLPRHIISINDLEFAVGPCHYCGGLASEAEALRALSEWSEWFGKPPSCAACGAPIRMTRVVLRHVTVGSGQGETLWKVAHVIFPNCLSLTAVVGAAVRLHGSCARKCFPHADWKSLDGDSLEHGRTPRPWDDATRRSERPHGAKG